MLIPVAAIGIGPMRVGTRSPSAATGRNPPFTIILGAAVMIIGAVAAMLIPAPEEMVIAAPDVNDNAAPVVNVPAAATVIVNAAPDVKVIAAADVTLTAAPEVIVIAAPAVIVMAAAAKTFTKDKLTMSISAGSGSVPRSAMKLPVKFPSTVSNGPMSFRVIASKWKDSRTGF